MSNLASVPVVRALLIVSVRAYREPLARALARAGIDVAGMCPDCVSALPRIGGLRPNVIVLETLTPEQHWSVSALKAAAPDTEIVALGVADSPTVAVALVEAGASGYVTRDQSVEDAAEVIRSVSQGEFPCSGRVAAILATRVSKLAAARTGVQALPRRLTSREREIAQLLAYGMSNKDIARRLHIELATVKNHVHNVLTKLDAARRSEVAAKLAGSVLPAEVADEAPAGTRSPGLTQAFTQG